MSCFRGLGCLFGAPTPANRVVGGGGGGGVAEVGGRDGENGVALKGWGVWGFGGWGFAFPTSTHFGEGLGFVYLSECV